MTMFDGSTGGTKTILDTPWTSRLILKLSFEQNLYFYSKIQINRPSARYVTHTNKEGGLWWPWEIHGILGIHGINGIHRIRAIHGFRRIHGMLHVCHELSLRSVFYMFGAGLGAVWGRGPPWYRFGPNPRKLPGPHV